MINAKELRIGNLVEYKITDKFDERKEWWEVSEIDADDIHWLSKVDTNDDDFRAIPITEEWLLKFGFSEIGGCNEKDFTNGDYNIFINSIGEVNFLFFREGDWYQKISYVHQLQNLYFALTGSELTVA